jgi:cadmium resistance protein CadD (predicted permease)
VAGFGLVGQAVGMVAVTNVDDVVLLALYFGQAAGHRGGGTRVVLGQYLGFSGILAVCVLITLGVDLLPDRVIPYLGVLPLLLGLRAAWQSWRERHAGSGSDATVTPREGGPSTLAVAGVTFANCGDNIGVYVPVFAVAGTGNLIAFVTVFLLLVAVLLAAGRFLATRPVIARVLARWGHIVLPAVLIGIGAAILVQGHAFGL